MPKLDAATLKLDHTHCRAICDEIGERLRQVLKPGTSAIPPHLAALLDRFKQLETGSKPYFEVRALNRPFHRRDVASAAPGDLFDGLSGKLTWRYLPPITDQLLSAFDLD